MTSEAAIAGVFIPGLLCAGLIALTVNLALRRILASAGFYRFVWHRALFDLALYITVLGGTVLCGSAAGWP